MAEMVYQEAELYEVAFSYRDYVAETRTIEAWFQRATGRTRIGAAIELASGPGLHAIELARGGTEVFALDISPTMCALAERRAREAGVAMATKCGDMIDFELYRRFDLAMLLLNSVAHIYTLDDLVRHLKTVARHLTPSGVFVIEFQHPKDFVGRGARRTGVSKPWTSRRGELEVEVRWGSPEDPYDSIAQIFEPTVELIARENGHEQRFVERVRMRDWTKTELDAAARLSGAFEIAAMHGDYLPDAKLDDSDESWRMIAVLRKT
jgi:SAM-dependent methyltransferase